MDIRDILPGGFVDSTMIRPDRPSLLSQIFPFTYRARRECSRDSRERVVVRNGTYEEVRSLVMNRNVINAVDDRGWTLLHEAAFRHDGLEIARYLISQGAIVNCGADREGTPLYVACKAANGEIAEMLILEAGADVNLSAARDMLGDMVCVRFTPLHVACNMGYEHVTEVLLENNAFVRPLDPGFRTPLHLAADHNHTTIALMLLQAGADPDCRDAENYSPFEHACITGSVETMELMFEYMGRRNRFVNQRSVNLEYTPLMLACYGGHRRMAKRLIELGANAATVTRYGVLALHLAATSNARLLRLLFRHTPYHLILRYMTFHPGPVYFHSLPCMLIDGQALNCLKLLYRSGVSEEVLKCPSRIRRHLLSPIVHLICFSDNWGVDSNKLEIFEYLLSHDFLIDPVYVRERVLVYTMTIFEVIVLIHNIHRGSGRNCSCDRFLALVLENVSSPQRVLPKKAYLVSAFCTAARDGFFAALEFFNYTAELEPDDIMEKYLEEIKQQKHLWTGSESAVIKYFVGKCFKDYSSTMTELRTLAMTVDEYEGGMMLRVAEAYGEARLMEPIPSLLRWSKYVLRKELLRQANNDFDTFKRLLRKLRLPFTVTKFILNEK